MKLTEAKLKKLILETMNEELIQEVAKGPQDLPEDVYVKVHKWNRRIVVLFTDANGQQIWPANFDTGEDNLVYGDVSFYENDPRGMPCDGSSIIAVSEVADGWGPFLYDIAMEVATMRTNGLTADRNVVSVEAQDVWDFYSQNRPDVKQFQLDDEHNSLTPEDEDNCGQYMARSTLGSTSWSDSPLSKRYTKEPTILNQIRDKLIWEL